MDDAGQRLVLGLGPDHFPDRVAWGLALAQMHALHGNAREVRAYADTARIAAEMALRTTPDDPQLHSLYGVSLAYLGQRATAVREGGRGVALVPVAKDASTFGPTRNTSSRGSTYFSASPRGRSTSSSRC